MEIAGIPEIRIGWGVLAIAFCGFVFAWRRRWKMALWYDFIGSVFLVIAIIHFNIVVSFGLVMIAVFRVMEFKRMHPKRNRYEL
jgi:hypothetical protein